MPQLSFKIQADYDKVQRLREEIAKLKQEIKGTDAMQAPQAFNVLNAKLVQTSQELGKVEGKIIAASATMETDFKQKIFAASQSVNGFTEKIIAQKAVVKDVAADVKLLGDAYREAKKYSPMSVDGKLAEWKAAKRALEEEKAALFGLTQEQAAARLSVKKLRDEYALFKQEGGGTAQTMDLLTSKMKGIAATIMGGMGLKELASHIISVRAEFESMETSLKVLLGGNQERLNSIMGQIKDYALASPLNTKDMVGAVQMMTSFGIEAEKSIGYLKAIGDISMGDTGKFNSLALAFSQMSSAGKLMGQDLLQMVNAGFNPLEEISRKTGKSIGQLKDEMSKGAISSKMVQDAFISATSAGGKFFGMSQEGAKTLNGQISMLQESFDMMFNEIGQKGEGVVMGAVQTATKLVENYEQVGRVLLGLVETYGAYRVGLAVATVAQNGHTLAMTLARTRILLAQKAQALFNATMLANPYVLAATALGALVGAVIAASDGLNDAEMAQRDFNNSLEEAKKKQDEYNRQTEEAISNANNDALANGERRKAMDTLISRYPSIIKKYIDEEGHLRDILGLKREIARLDGKETVSNLQNQANLYKEYVRIIKKIKSNTPLTEKERHLYQNAKTAYDKNTPWYKEMNLDNGIAYYTQKAKEADKQAGRTTANNTISEFQESIGKMGAKRLETLKKTLDNAKKTKKNVILSYKELNGAVLNQSDIDKLSTYVDGVYTSKTKKITTKRDLQEQKKKIQAQLDALSEIEAKGKKGAELRKKINAISEREKVYSATSDTKAATKAERERKQQIKEAKAQQKANEDLTKQKIVQSEAELELENQVGQSRIDSLVDGSEKTIAAMKLAHKREMEQIEKQKQDYLKKKQEKAKAEFEADPKNKDKVFNMSSVTLSADEQGKFDEMRANTLKKHANEERDYQIQQIQALNDYLKEYGSFEEKKLAITQEYEEKIRKAGSVGEKASLEMQRDKDIEKAKNDDLQNTIDWNGIFSDLQGHTRQYLQGLRNQLQELLNTGSLPIDQMQVVSEKINAIDDELGKQQGIWDFVGERSREHNRLLKEAEDAQERLNVAKKEEANADFYLTSTRSEVQRALSKAGLDFETENVNTSFLNGKIDLADEKFKDVAPLLQRLAVAEGKLTEARKKTTDATNKAKQAEDRAKERPIDAILRWFGGKQDFIKDKGIDQLPDLLGSVGLGKAGEKVSQGLGAFNSAAGAAADFASGNYIGAAFKGISAIKSFGSVLGIGGGNAAAVNRTTERLTKSNEELAKRIDSLSEVIGNSAGAKAVNAYETALKAQEEIKANNMEVLKAQMGYHKKHHSNTYYASDKEIASYNRDAQLAFKAAGVDSANITGLDSIYSLSPEQLKAIRDFAPNLWKYLTEVGKYDKKEYWDAVVEQAGKTEKLTEQIKNNLTQTSFDNLRSGFLDTLMDMDADARDWSNDFGKMMFKSMVNRNVLNDGFDKWLNGFQERWADKVKSGNMSQSDYATYREEYNRKMQELKTQTDNLAAAVGYSDTSSSQKAATNGISSITYEQASNIVALTTAGNISRDQVKDIITGKLSSIDVSTRGLQNLVMEHKSIADDLRTIQANSYIELQGIHEDTTSMSKTLKAMSSEVSEIKRELKNM